MNESKVKKIPLIKILSQSRLQLQALHLQIMLTSRFQRHILQMSIKFNS